MKQEAAKLACAVVHPLQKDGKVFINLEEASVAFGCAKGTFIMAYRRVLAKRESNLKDVHIVNQKNVYVSILLLKEICSHLYSMVKLQQFLSDNTDAFFQELFSIEKDMQNGKKIVCTVPKSVHQKHYRKGTKQLVSAMQIGDDFSVLPSEIYMSLKMLKSEYNLKEGRDFFVGKNPIIHNGDNVAYDRPYFTHTGLIAVSMKLLEKNGYEVKRVVEGFVRCMNTRFVFEAPENSVFEYDDYMTMITRYYKKYYLKAHLSTESLVELKDLVQRFAALR